MTLDYKNIIVISGKQRSGKDTVCEMLLNKLTNFKRIGIGDAIKMEYSEITGIPYEEVVKNKEKYRQGLIDLATKRRAEDENYWLKKITGMKDNLIIPDMRVKREYDHFVSEKAYTVRINASQKARAERGVLVGEEDYTETELDKVKKWDYMLTNNTDLQTLQAKVDKLLKDVKAKLHVDNAQT